MAIGLGRIFGFRIPENFNYPYTATSITDFWRRWHISLSLWFRDYIYIPLGGNRVNKSRFMLNILIVWSLTGLWHGASWNFVLWGLYYGILLLIEKLVLGARIEKIPMLFRRISSLFFIIIGWVLFNLSDTQTLLSVLKEMFIFSPTDWVSLLIQDTSICSKLLFLPIAVVFAFPVVKKVNLPDNSIWGCIINNVAHMAVLAFSIMYIISSNFTPFIYFSF
jgi:alginate O-acetyltransferase complex protein AlgI